MELSIFDKIGEILKYFTRSFLGIEMFILSLVLIIFLILNLKKKSLKINLVLTEIIVFIMIFIIGGYESFIKSCLKTFVKYIIYLYYFPNIAVYFMSVIFTTVILIFTMYTKKIEYKKKVFNIVTIGLILTNFLALISHTISEGIKLTLSVKIYKDTLILSCIEVSNLLLCIYIIVTIVYYLYRYLKKTYDE